MLLNISALQRWRLEARDGEIGSIVDVLFDDASWTIRSLLVETGDWLPSGRVLLPPVRLRRGAGEFGLVHTDLDREQLRGFAEANADGPDARVEGLRRSSVIIGYAVEASDGDAGDLDDLAVDDEHWSIPYLVVDTRRWWPGGRVLVPVAAVREIRDADAKVLVDRPRADLQHSTLDETRPGERE